MEDRFIGLTIGVSDSQAMTQPGVPPPSISTGKSSCSASVAELMRESRVEKRESTVGKKESISIVFSVRVESFLVVEEVRLSARELPPSPLGLYILGSGFLRLQTSLWDVPCKSK